MLKSFIDFVDSILPSVEPDFRDGVKEAITQFEQSGRVGEYFTSSPLAVLSQGDIISRVPFNYYNAAGSPKTFQADAMVLSMSCDIDNKKYIVLSPVFPIDQFDGDIKLLKHNTIFNYMYLPGMYDKYIDLTFINTYKKDLILKGIQRNKITKLASLSQLGYYFFIVKLTVYLMRKEDARTLELRNKSSEGLTERHNVEADGCEKLLS